MAVDLHIVRRVAEHGGRLGAIEEDVIGGRLQRRAGIEPVIAEQPEIAGPGDGEAREGLKLIREVRVVHRSSDWMRKSISGSSNPMASMSKSRTSSDSSFRRTANAASSQEDLSVNLWSASM